MSFEGVLFWATTVILFELLYIRTAAYLLASLLCFLVVLVFFLFWLEFDILASLLFGVYSSVFIVFFLLLLHFSTFWALGLKKTQTQASLRTTLVYLLVPLILCLMVFVGYSITPLGFNWSFSFLWQDFFFANLISTSMLAHILHFFFFRFFIYETILLNLYLLFSLILALALLALLRLYVNLKLISQKKTTHTGLDQRSTKAHTIQAQSHSDRVRQTNKFRRQTRRQNSSIIKHK